MKDDFLTATSHELRTPLHAMINLSRMMLEGRKGTLNAEQQEDLYYIQRESLRLSGLVDDLMDASTVEMGSRPLNRKAVNVFETCREIIHEVRLLAEESKPVEFKCAVEEQFPLIDADHARFKQILFNLLHNAYKFTESGHISVSAEVKGDLAEFIVEDTGIGIAEKHMDRIFESLYRCEPTSQEYGLGLGLAIVKRLVEDHGGTIRVESTEGQGSAFVFTIPLFEREIGAEVTHLQRAAVVTAQLNGAGTAATRKEAQEEAHLQRAAVVTAQPNGAGSEAAQGAVQEAHVVEALTDELRGAVQEAHVMRTLTDELREAEHAEALSQITAAAMAEPAEPAYDRVEEMRGEAATPADLHPNGDFAILVIDDEPSNRKVLRDLLLGEGYRVFATESGTQALPLIRQHGIDLVILDFMLPDMPGDQVCNEIRKEYSMSELPLLMITASGRRRDLGRSFECGANDFIKKPSDPGELRSRIASLLRMKVSAEDALRKEFHYFYAQISPHFLYNTLNTIIGISYRDGEAARAALLSLGTYLRGKMEYYGQRTLIPLADELDLVEAYLDIEKLRFTDRLNVELDVENSDGLALPPLTLQPLVENAVKHGLQDEEALHIRLTGRQAPGVGYVITIEDSGPGIATEEQARLLRGESSGLGFANVLQKVRLIRGASMHIESMPCKGSRIVLIFREGNHENHPRGR